MLGGCNLILVTVGTQLCFDRLVYAVNEWAIEHANEEIVAQIGPTKYRPEKLSYYDFLSPEKADELFRVADLIVSHAGMGSILTALKYRKPILIMPRQASLGEHRNDHQIATAKWFCNTPGITVAKDELEIKDLLNKRSTLSVGVEISNFASLDLINNIKEFIDSN